MTPFENQRIARRAIADLDVVTARRHWAELFPHIRLGNDDADILKVLHICRTQTPGIAVAARRFSHEWLIDRGLPSMLPDELKPKRDQQGERVALGVGISVNFSNPILKPIGAQVERAMADAVLEADAAGRLGDSRHVRARMIEAKDRAIRRLVGR